jgi:hypothetical protein
MQVILGIQNPDNMLAEPENLGLLLPYGEMLRDFLEQPFIGRGDLKNTLRRRGIVVSGSNKEDTIPIAACCLFSPIEFGHLKNCQHTREDNPKRTTRYLDWNVAASLIHSIPDSLELGNLLHSVAPYCRLRGSPTFVPVGNDQNHIRLEFTLDRKDYSKSWAMTHDVFKGSIALERLKSSGVVKIVLTHTARETKQLGILTSNSLKRHFAETGCLLPGSEEQRILFDDFTNEGRVQFLLGMTGDNGTSVLLFDDVVDFDVCPDSAVGPLPKELSWMDKKVQELKLKGVKLHETVFMKEKQYHKYLHLHKLDVKFNFQYHAASGSCIISFGFDGFLDEAKRKAEFESNISSLNLSAEFRDVSKIAVKEFLSRAIELFTLRQYKACTPQTAPTSLPVDLLQPTPP